MDQACDANPRVPAKNYGRLGWFVNEFETRYNVKVTAETIRKWFAGEVRPRHKTLMMLAQILQVDDAWFAVGRDNAVPEKQRKLHGAQANGVVNVIAGLVQLDGGTPAFPDATGPIDLSAVIKAALYNFHIVLGHDDGEKVSFAVSVGAENTVVLGVLRVTHASFEIYELPWEIVASKGVKRSGHITLTVDRVDLGGSLRKIESFTNRL